MGFCDFYVKNKTSGVIHRVGDDPHDRIWIGLDGELHYFNSQDREGCSGKTLGIDAAICGYEFVPSMDGIISLSETE